MDLDFTPEQDLLRETVAGVCQRYCDLKVVREMEDDPRGFPDKLWAQLADLGLIGLTLPEEYGGTGMKSPSSIPFSAGVHGEWSETIMTIGRAVSLCLRNIGGQRAGDTSRTVFGQPARFGMCFGEWEERSPWPSLAQRRGFTAEQEVMTVHGGKGTFPMADVNNDSAEDLTYTIAKTISFPQNNWYLEPTGESGQLVLCVNPMWAERFGKEWPNVEDFQQYLWEWAWQPIDLFRPGNAEVLETKGRVDDQGRVRLCSRPEQLVPVVCGGLGSLHAVALTSFCESEMQSVAATRA